MLDLLRAAAQTPDLNLAELLDLVSKVGALGLVTIGLWAFFTNRVYTRKQYEAMVAERDEARGDYKAIQSVTMTELIPLVTRMTDTMRSIEERIEPAGYTVRRRTRDEK